MIELPEVAEWEGKEKRKRDLEESLLVAPEWVNNRPGPAHWFRKAKGVSQPLRYQATDNMRNIF